MNNPIEIVCYYVAQPIVDFLAYLLNDVHYLAFVLAISLLGTILGLVMGIISVIWYKCSRPECDKQREPIVKQGEGDEGEAEQKMKLN